MKDYRLKIIDHNQCATFFVRKGDRTSYISGNETPLALANLLQASAAETRFKLEDAIDGADAAKILREVLSDQWKNNKPMCPYVQVLS